MNARILGDTLSLIIDQGEDGLAHLTWFGPQADEEMAAAPVFQRLPASPDIAVGPTLLPEHGRGFHGISQVEGHCAATHRRIRLGQPELIEQDGQILLTAEDAALGLTVRTRLYFDGDVLVQEGSVSNTGAHTLSLQRAASLLLPAPDWASEVRTHAGAWGREGHPVTHRWTAGRIEQSGRSGRPGFDGGPTLSLTETNAGVAHGRWLTVHLAWSGPFRLAAERATDGSGQVLAERLFLPGEVCLRSGETLDLPAALMTRSAEGSNGISTRLHARQRRQGRSMRRPVHFNTWEARYFSVAEADCIALAKGAAALGAERFVLDDGWFKGRRNDQTSLGDWTVDADLFPNGLTPLINAVHAEGMEFGLWLEPEMVSPDSDLYRAHPDWVLGWPEPDLATGRNQLVLDLALEPVREHLFTVISDLLDRYAISYLKWDCNRDLYPATRDGIVRAGAQTEGLYRLLDRLRARYPVEIESCASGGGRIDAGIAARTDRFWTSDATDAIDRLNIQRAAGLVMPHERLGAHVGPSPNPMTGRQVSMSFRVLAALFGHFGIEADPEKVSEDDRRVLTRGIEIYKQHRDWMHAGDLLNLSEPDTDPDVQLVRSDDGHQALLRVMRVGTPMRPLQSRLRLAGLDPAARYSLSEIALEGTPIHWPLGAFSGAGLMNEGLNLDPGRALTGRLIYIERTG